MLRTLVRFQIRRHRLLFVLLPLLVVAHEWIFLYVYQFWREQAQISQWLLRFVPDSIRESTGIPLTDLTDARTFKALYFLRPDFRVLTLLFGIVVGTDVIAGEVGRGTADLLFAHPIRRGAAVAAGAITILLHALVMGCTMTLSFLVGTLVFPMGANAPAVSELFPCYLLIMTASVVISMVALLAGSAAATRGRAVGASLLLILGPLMLGFIGIFVKPVEYVSRIFPEYYYKPQVLLIGGSAHYGWSNWVALAVLGAIAFIAAVRVAERRDLAS